MALGHGRTPLPAAFSHSCPEDVSSRVTEAIPPRRPTSLLPPGAVLAPNLEVWLCPGPCRPGSSEAVVRPLPLVFWRGSTSRDVVLLPEAPPPVETAGPSFTCGVWGFTGSSCGHTLCHLFFPPVARGQRGDSEIVSQDLGCPGWSVASKEMSRKVNSKDVFCFSAH